MPSRNHGWHKRWRLDNDAAGIVHDSGLIVSADCMPLNTAEWRATIAEFMPGHQIDAHLSRLLREARMWFDYRDKKRAYDSEKMARDPDWKPKT